MIHKWRVPISRIYLIIFYVNLHFTISATRPTHHKIDTLTAVGKTDRLWNSILCPTVRSAAAFISLCPNIYIEGQAQSFDFTDWLTDQWGK